MCGEKGVCVGEFCEVRCGEESEVCEGVVYCYVDCK